MTFSANGSNAAQNTALTFTKAGTYDVSVKIVDPSGLSVTNSLTLNVTPTFTSIKVSTPSGTVLNSATSLQVLAVSQSLVAQGLDQFGNALATQPTFKWSTSTVPSGAPTPTLSASGATETFTFGKIGSYVESVTGTAAGGVSITSKATLLVVAKPSYITVTQVGGTSPVTGTTAQFTVSQFQDQFHNAITETSQVTWMATTRPSGAVGPDVFHQRRQHHGNFQGGRPITLNATETDNAGNSVSQAWKSPAPATTSARSSSPPLAPGWRSCYPAMGTTVRR